MLSVNCRILTEIARAIVNFLEQHGYMPYCIHVNRFDTMKLYNYGLVKKFEHGELPKKVHDDLVKYAKDHMILQLWNVWIVPDDVDNYLLIAPDNPIILE